MPARNLDALLFILQLSVVYFSGVSTLNDVHAKLHDSMPRGNQNVCPSDTSGGPSSSPSPISAFTNAFKSEVQNNSVLQNAMHVADLPPVQAAKKFYTVVKKVLQDMGNANPSRNADILKDSVNSTFGSFNSSSYPSVIGNMFGNILNNRGLLTDRNAAELASEYASTILLIVHTSLESPPDSYIQGIMQGASDFFTALGVPYFGNFTGIVNIYEEAAECITTPRVNKCPYDASRGSSSSPSDVSAFTRAFKKNVQSNSVLQKVLKVADLPPDQAAEKYETVVKRVLQEMGNAKPSRNAEILKDSVKSTFGSLTPSSYATVMGNLYGKMLKSKGLLTDENAAELANEYASTILLVVHTSEASPPESYIQGIMQGSSDFFTALGVPFFGNFSDIAHSYVETVECVT